MLQKRSQTLQIQYIYIQIYVKWLPKNENIDDFQFGVPWINFKFQQDYIATESIQSLCSSIYLQVFNWNDFTSDFDYYLQQLSMSRYEDNKYPLQPPYEDQVFFYEGTKVSLNPQGIEKKAKICPICSYPIHIRIVSFPCSHYFCFECYNKSTYACALCSSLNARTLRIDDYAQFYSCDTSCYKYFRTEEELQQHKASHQLLHQ